MKTKQIFACLGVVLLLTVSCKKDENGLISAEGGTTTPAPVVKQLFSSDWSVSNNAWSLDFSLGNLTNNAYSSTVNFAGGGTCTCTTTMSGSQTAGTYLNDCSVGVQVSGTPSLSTCNSLDYSPVGSYTNVGGILTLCRSSGSCTLVYH